MKHRKYTYAFLLFKNTIIVIFILRLDEVKEIRKDIIRQGGGVANHNLYFSILGSKPKKYPTGQLLNEINRRFGDFSALKEELSNKSINQFGAGYGWLVIDKKGELDVISTSNQDSPLMFKMRPILTIDIWEHAYYLKYKNLRAQYVKNIWNVIDWNKVEEIYLKECSK